MFELGRKTIESIKEALNLMPEPALAGLSVSIACGNCQGTCKERCTGGCKGGCAGSCTRSCEGRSR